MSVNVLESENPFFSQIQLSKFVISILSIIWILGQFFITNDSGSTVTWGAIGQLDLVFFQASNVNFFFIVSLFGNFLILVSSLPILESKKNLINKKQIQLLGFFLYFLGVLSYFGFLFFEPFLYLYLSIIAFTYYNLLTFNVNISFLHFQTPFFYQPDYNGFNFTMELSLWNSNTKNLILNYYNNGVLEIFLLLVVLFLLFQTALLIKEKGSVIPQKFAIFLDNWYSKRIQFKNSSKNRFYLALIFLVVQYVLYAFLLANNSFYLAFLLFILLIPFYRKNEITIELRRLRFLKIKMYDIYIFNFLLLIILSYFFQLVPNLFLLFVTLFLWLFVKIWSRTSSFLSDSELDSNQEILTELSIFKFFMIFYFIIIVLYIASWLTTISEDFYFQILFISTLLLLSPKIVKNFFNKDVLQYAYRRFLLIIPMLTGISIIVYMVMSISGNPIKLAYSISVCTNTVNLCGPSLVEYLNHYYGFDQPIQIQWVNWFFHFLQGDFGREIILGNSPVVTSFMNKIGPTLEISLLPIILALAISIPLGIKASKKQFSIIGTLILLFISIGMSVPLFVSLMVFIYIFKVNLMELPASGRLALNPEKYLLYTQVYVDGIPLNFDLIFNGVSYFNFQFTLHLQDIITWEKYDWLMHMIIPVICVTFFSLAMYTRLTRSGMIDVLKTDYILSARASGFSEREVIYKHALRNVVLPILTLLGLSVGTLLSISPITEKFLEWPGIGLYYIQALHLFDYYVLMAITMIIALLLLVANLIVDILYSIIDPRIRLINSDENN